MLGSLNVNKVSRVFLCFFFDREIAQALAVLQVAVIVVVVVVVAVVVVVVGMGTFVLIELYDAILL